jgi:hypothetical protein
MAAVDDYRSAGTVRSFISCTYRDLKQSLDVGDRSSLHVDDLLQ